MHELAALGIGLDLAPDVDVNSSPDNPVIGVRSFGDDPVLVARHAAAWVEGLQSTGVAACAKHFPGHGDTVVDSHHGLPRVDVTLRGAPASASSRPSGPPSTPASRAVMTSHIVVSALDPHRPATFSRTVIGVLRDELGFDGVIVSDALDMAGASAETGIPEAAVRALVAGVDLLCLGSDTCRRRTPRCTPPSWRPCGPGGCPRTAWPRPPAGCAPSRRRPASGCRRPGIRADAHRLAHPVRRRPSCRRLPRRRRRRGPGSRRPGPVAVVQVDSTANLAVGGVAVGPGRARRDGGRGRGAGRRAGRGRGPRRSVPATRHPPSSSGCAPPGHDVVLVECGWPRGGADIETFGGSPAVARALLALLRGEVGP